MFLGARVAGATAVLALLSSCVFCGQLAGSSGVSLVFDESLGDARLIVVEACDRDGCGRTTQRLASTWAGRVFMPAEDIGRALVVGERLEVTATLRSPSGRVSFRGRQRITVEASQPNGAACDGDRWPAGVVDFR